MPHLLLMQVSCALARGTDVALRLDVQGAATMRKLYPRAIFLFLVRCLYNLRLRSGVHSSSISGVLLVQSTATMRKLHPNAAALSWCAVSKV